MRSRRPFNVSEGTPWRNDRLTRRIAVAVCENFKPELDAALASGRFPEVRGCTFASRCGRGPMLAADVAALSEAAGTADVHVFGSACVAMLARSASRPANLQVHNLGSCHELVTPRAVLDACIGRGAYLVSGSWLSAWEAHLDGLGADRALTCSIIAESCKTVVLVDGGTDAPGRERLAEFAAVVGLPSEVLHVGTEVLETRLQLIQLEHRHAEARAQDRVALLRSQQDAAAFSMALGVLSDLAGEVREAGVISGLFQLFETLFACEQMTFSPVGGGSAVQYPPGPARETWALAADTSLALLDGGFLVALHHRNERIGVLQVDGLAHPEHRARYANLASHLGGVCGLAIMNARQREQLAATQRALAAEKDLLLTTLQSIGDGVLAFDTSGRVTLLNGVAEGLIGWAPSAARGRDWRDVLHLTVEPPGEGSLIERVLATGAPTTLPAVARLRHVDGSFRLVAGCISPIRSVDGAVTGTVVGLRDVTPEHLARERQRVERLESLGVFAGGLAHEFNNLLSAMMSNLAVAQTQLTGTFERELIDDAVQAGRRAADLTRHLQTFSRGGAPSLTTTSLEAVLRERADAALVGTRCRVEVDIADGLWSAIVDIDQIGQVIRQLVANADQAMPTGGVVRIACSNVAPASLAGLPVAPGPYVKIIVEDDGPGVPPEHRAQVFDPFFTTKANGTGLGLAVVHSIVRRHHGHVALHTAPGGGARFEIYLPAVERKAGPPKVQTAGVLAGLGRVLLMDDEPMVLRSTARVLTRLGYTVHTTVDGDEAIAAYRAALQAGEPFEVVVLDLTVPGGKGGIETLRELLVVDPEVRAIACTGYVNAPVVADAGSFGFAGAVVKPFDLATFSRVVKEASRRLA